MSTTTTVRALPDLDGFDTHYRVRISCVGDDGDMVMLGHVPPRRAIAAVRAYLRRLLGNQIEVDDQLNHRLGRIPWVREFARTHDADDMFTPGQHRWATLVRTCDRWPVCRDPGHECGTPAPCETIATYPWWITWDGVTADTPDAFPITYWAE